MLVGRRALAGMLAAVSASIPGLCIPGGISTAGRWIYFAAILNWAAPGTTDPAAADRFVAAMRDVLQPAVDGLT